MRGGMIRPISLKSLVRQLPSLTVLCIPYLHIDVELAPLQLQIIDADCFIQNNAPIEMIDLPRTLRSMHMRRTGAPRELLEPSFYSMTSFDRISDLPPDIEEIVVATSPNSRNVVWPRYLRHIVWKCPLSRGDVAVLPQTLTKLE